MIISFLSTFEESGGKYVSWKNNHEIEKVLAGDSDLDIFVPAQYRVKFLRLIKEQHWIQVTNPVADYPGVNHFYAIDENLTVFHLHVYFKVITGESWLKEYEFPLDDFLMENRISHSSGIYILNEKVQSFLFVLRHFIKGRSFFSRLLYKKELSSYQEEWDLCKSAFDPKAKDDLIDFTEYMETSGLTGNLDLPDTSVARSVREKLKGFLRYPESRLTLLRLQSFKSRLFNKLFYKRKKLLPNTGFILVFSGADGVGKSTMSETIGKAYKSFLTVRSVQLGRPQSAWVEAIRKILNKQGAESKNPTLNLGDKRRKITLKRAISAVYLAYLRYVTAKKAYNRYRKHNYLTISDRWPTLEYYKMDGPKLDVNELNGFYRKLAVIEKRYYDRLAFADLSIILTVPVEVAIQRNRDRIKEGKETDEEIKERYMQNANHNPKSHEIIRFDNNGGLHEKRYDLIKLIQNRLSTDL